MIHSDVFADLKQQMNGFDKPWFVAGGWTIDLFVGEVTRSHKDVDLCLFREDAEYALEYFHEWDIYVAIPGEQRLEKVRGIQDIESPRYGLHMYKDKQFLEILLTNRTDDQILFRKNTRIQMSLDEFSKKSGELPYVNPAWQLLFKSLNPREEDEHDFLIYLHRSAAERPAKLWLQENMKAMNGSPSWIEELDKHLLKT
ncbi:nucleotidyltransferase domain-containing protein [Paenibacillus physcomitrellae]|uniref:Amino acid transporter n=1 Tax=Paenibacillus physcomitrellae TaxID=1619311 RepID=A0ABQ1FTF8_9BACL|nr:hypothetical protein [Paenibacillus physcomitrellae]GGA29463.1 hypothetical protein GCM10010917_13100 [Paenibacillus physcomitrellae]